MAEDENGAPLSNGEDTTPQAGMLSQYVKDFSFENPNAPNIYSGDLQPQVDVQFGIQSAQVGEDVFEVVLKVEVKAQSGSQTAFLVDLSFAGLFALRNVPGEQIEAFLLGEAPRLMFPFARRILADAVRDGGFPPLLLEPIDFNGLFLQRLAAQQDGQQVEAGQA